jgi:adenylate cyclase
MTSDEGKQISFRRPWRQAIPFLAFPRRWFSMLPFSRIATGIARQLGRLRSPVWQGALIGLVLAVFCWCISGTALIRALENWELDGCFLLRGRRPSTANIIIVAIDDASLRELQKPMMFISPELAKVVDYLHDQGAAAIGVDFMVPDDKATIDYLQPNGPGDVGPMGVAVGRAGNVVLPEWRKCDPTMMPIYEWRSPSSRPWVDLGLVDFWPDSDLCLRRQVLRMSKHPDEAYVTMALALLAKARDEPQQWLDAEELAFDGVKIPLNADGTLQVNYVGPAGSIRAVSFREVLAAAGKAQQQEAEVRAAQGPYQNAIVLIGGVGNALKDEYPTPFTNPSILQSVRSATSKSDEMMSGVEFHANVLATLSDRAFITTPWWLSTFWLLLIVGGAMGALLARCSLEAGALLTIGHHLAWRALAVSTFCFRGWRVEMVPMLMLGGMLYATIFAMRWRWIRRMMGMVKSEAVARALETGKVRLDLRGQQRAITVLFCDVRDFTPFSESHTAQEVVGLLNEFFTAVVPAIEAEGGIVNQYIGDALMVLFGAPQTQHDHAQRAVRAALEIVRRVHALGDRWKVHGAEAFRIGIGVHTGEAVVGMIGSPKRLDYTAIGDTVNTAARIESANKELQSELLVSQATFAALPEDQRQEITAMSELKSLSVKGKQETLRVFVLRTHFHNGQARPCSGDADNY